MRRIFILLSFLFLLSCSPYKVHTYFASEYGLDSYDEMVYNVYQFLDFIGVDSIPLNEWLVFQEYIENGHKIERILQKRFNEESEFLFIISTYVDDYPKYIFSVKLRTKNKEVIKNLTDL